MADGPVRVGVYARISEDRDGQQTATARQMQDAREFAARRDWEIVDTFEDVDLSAYNTRVKRPEFERMLDALRSREIDGVLVWDLRQLRCPRCSRILPVRLPPGVPFEAWCRYCKQAFGARGSADDDHRAR